MKRIMLLILLLFAIGCAKEIETSPVGPSEEIETSKITGEAVSQETEEIPVDDSKEYETLNHALDLLIKMGNKISSDTYTELKQRTDALADKGTDVSSLREKLENLS